MMEREEWDEAIVECADCGASITEGTEPLFAFGQNGVLCFECAMRRGGEFDESEDRWTTPPNLSGLERELEEY